MQQPVSDTDWKAVRGLVAVYKPIGPTSHDIIDRLRRLTGERTIGHAGTLDPFARGVLVVGIGRDATKILTTAVQKEKEYIATIRLGAKSTTDDLTGQLSEVALKEVPSREAIDAALQKFVGEIMQLPPAFSAIKTRGGRAYKQARKGQPVILQARPVFVKEIEVLSYTWPDVTVRVVSGPGVYIRAIGRDLGLALHTGGYVAALERTRVGEWESAQSLRLPPHFKDRS